MTTASAAAPRHDALDEAFQALARASTSAGRLAGLGTVLVAAGARSGAARVSAADRVVERCESDPAARAALARALTALFRESSTLGLLAESGLPNDRGLWKETTDRLARKLLPRPRDEHDLARALDWFLPRRRDLGALAQFAGDDLVRLILCLARAGLDSRPLTEAACDALVLLATRIAALGLTEEMRERADSPSVLASPFHRLMLATQDVLAARERQAGVPEALAAWKACAIDVRAACDAVHAHLEGAGVSLDLVFSIDAIDACLSRMQELLAVLTAADREAGARAAAGLLLRLLAGWQADSSLRELLRANTRLLARRVIDRAGRTGEHYITTTRREYVAMLASAAGGGVLTAITAAFKLVILALGGPLFVQGLLGSLNYAASFVAIQHLGFTLATKQPSMTAATLAGIMSRTGSDRAEELVTHVARIVRSQLAAAGSNIVCVAAGAWALQALWRGMRGTSFLEPHEIEHVLESLHPWHSLTAFHAALTGVLLWLSSVCGGLIENWATFRRIPAAIAEHRWGRRLGTDRLKRAARFVELHLSGWGGNVSLGFLLGMTPSVGRFFGLPLDVRHVTLSTGMLALALSSLGPGCLAAPGALPALLGIGVIFVLNLSVSFGLALVLAMRARDVQAADRRAFLSALGRRLAHSPWEFLVPPQDARAEPGHRH